MPCRCGGAERGARMTRRPRLAECWERRQWAPGRTATWRRVPAAARTLSRRHGRPVTLCRAGGHSAARQAARGAGMVTRVRRLARPHGAADQNRETLGNPGVSGRRPRPQCQKTQGFRGFAADRPIRSGRLTLQRPPVAMSIWQNRFGSFGLAVSVWQSAARPLWHFGFGTLRSI